jgi:hypothetical protein
LRMIFPSHLLITTSYRKRKNHAGSENHSPHN